VDCVRFESTEVDVWIFRVGCGSEEDCTWVLMVQSAIHLHNELPRIESAATRNGSLNT
jgi:hypothetical protein